MKKLLFVLAVIAANVFFTASAASVVVPVTTKIAKATPPPAVVKSFTSMFGNAPVREWKLRSNGQWRVYFMRNGRAWEATFTNTGALVKSEPA